MLKFTTRGSDYRWEVLKFVKLGSDYSWEVLKFRKRGSDYRWEVLKFVKLQSFSSSSSRKTCERNLLYQMECFAGAAVSAQAWGAEGMLPVRELIPDGKRGLRESCPPAREACFCTGVGYGKHASRTGVRSRWHNCCWTKVRTTCSALSFWSVVLLFPPPPNFNVV